MPDPLTDLEQRREVIVQRIAELGDLRPGSITGTSGRCGKPECHCHQPGQPGHGPNFRLTYKVDGKTISEALPTPAAIQKAEREVEEFRKFLPGGVSMSQFALRWILMFDAVSCAIPGGKRPEQVAENCKASDLPALTEEAMAGVRRVYESKILPLVKDRW